MALARIFAWPGIPLRFSSVTAACHRFTARHFHATRHLPCSIYPRLLLSDFEGQFAEGPIIGSPEGDEPDTCCSWPVPNGGQARVVAALSCPRLGGRERARRVKSHLLTLISHLPSPPLPLRPPSLDDFCQISQQLSPTPPRFSKNAPSNQTRAPALFTFSAYDSLCCAAIPPFSCPEHP